jgi:hypothetical protein
MACYGMKVSPSTSFGLGLEDDQWLAEHDEDGNDWFSRFCFGKLDLPPELKPMNVDPEVNADEEMKLWRWAFEDDA